MNDKSKVGGKYRVVQIGKNEYIVQKNVVLFVARQWVCCSATFFSESDAIAVAERMIEDEKAYPKVIKTW